jgi:aryl-alcohol dehydrogenase
MGAKYSKLKTIVAIDIVQSRLDLAKELGATHCINARDPDVKEQIEKATEGEMLDLVVETSGARASLNLAWGSLGMSGVHAQLAPFPVDATADIDVRCVLPSWRCSRSGSSCR